MLKIKTILHKFGDPEEFDSKVNAALATGWKLVKREVLPESEKWHPHFYAEFEREDNGEKPTWKITDTGVSTQFRCPVCGFEYEEGEPGIKKGCNYCPECGAENG